MENKKDFTQLMMLNQALQNLSQSKHPFNILLAKNIKIVDELVKSYNEKRDAVIDQFAIRDDAGEFVGVWIDDPEVDKSTLADSEEIAQVRMKNPQKIDDIEWTDREACLAGLNELGAEKIDIILSPVDVNKKYLDTKTGKEQTIYEYIDGNFESGLLIFLNGFGFFTGLDI